MTERNVYQEPEDKVLLRTADVYQTEAVDDVSSYSDRLLAIVADFKNSGVPDGANAQSMVGKSKRGEVACRLFARIDPQAGIIEAAGFKARGCLAMTACASAACLLIEGKPLEDALAVGIEDIRASVDGVPAGKVNALHFAACAIQALVGDFLLRDGAPVSEVEEAVSCDASSVSCIMAEHCSHRQSLLEARMEEDERQRARAEEDACAACFDLVRRNTGAGKLTAPGDWAALVPAHLMPDEFASVVLGRLDADAEVALAGISEGGAKVAAPATASAAARGASPDAAGTAAPARSPFANRGVGVPHLFTRDAAAEAAAGRPSPEVPSEQDVAAMANAADALSAAGAPGAGGRPGPSVLDDVPHVFDYGRDAADIAAADDDDDLVPPEGYELVEVDGQWGLVKTDRPPAPKPRSADATGIKLMRGATEAYLYDGGVMTDAFARWAYLAAEDDPLATFAFCVREDSRTYPRPMAQSCFANEPLCLSAREVDEIWEQAHGMPEYADIQTVSASNGDVYFYSTDYLGAEHARSLAEWASVERFYNV